MRLKDEGSKVRWEIPEKDPEPQDPEGQMLQEVIGQRVGYVFAKRVSQENERVVVGTTSE